MVSLLLQSSLPFSSLKLTNRRRSTIMKSRHTIRAQASGQGTAEEGAVFVAGATGKVGSRTVRELLKLGCRVKAGVRSKERAKPLLESVQKMQLNSDVSNTSILEKLEICECDLENSKEIGPVISGASAVVCCIGASEKEVFDVTGPYRIDYRATTNLIEAAAASNINHFILVTSLGTNKLGFPAAILNLFWGVLIWKRKAEEALISSGMPFTIVRPGGMERPTDAFKLTHNIVLASGDTYFGGLVSNLQVAELMAFMIKNREQSMNKVVEVIAETTAPLLPMGDLLSGVPSLSGNSNIKATTANQVLKPLASPTPNDPRSFPAAKEASIDASQKSVPSSTDEIGSSVSLLEQKEKKDAKGSPVIGSRPLSPYAAYDDLKPPTSPRPKAPKGLDRARISTIQQTVLSPPALSTGDNPAEPVSKNQKPLSPYSTYEDLKPPTSPTPTAPGILHVRMHKKAEYIVDGQEASNVKLQNGRPLSPYTAYEDLKPPTSPSPRAPNA